MYIYIHIYLPLDWRVGTLTLPFHRNLIHVMVGCGYCLSNGSFLELTVYLMITIVLSTRPDMQKNAFPLSHGNEVKTGCWNKENLIYIYICYRTGCMLTGLFQNIPRYLQAKLLQLFIKWITMAGSCWTHGRWSWMVYKNGRLLYPGHINTDQILVFLHPTFQLLEYGSHIPDPFLSLLFFNLSGVKPCTHIWHVTV